MHIVLYFGSFNPIHTGHLIIASAVVERTEVDALWFVVSPHNPFKNEQDLWDEHVRLDLVKKSISNDNRLSCCEIEYTLPKPSYTIDTLAALKKRFPAYTFSILIGSDNVEQLPKWKAFDELIANHQIYVYPRLNFPTESLSHPHMVALEAPIIELSATYIRQLIQEKKSVKYIVPSVVEEYIQTHLYI
jgi:nicotinate-nucleotide adenylyltransferase